ncbi:curli biogenesis system outer membrane secretion channel CsgG [Allocatelliglobosispora scoriae]|uniref:Curli biogenesis system outer membrane secretion channel CsgG n=1 Tax=Allocatelliglobosispora scoriae TaxID=643052 RepID=A0A841BZ27_9ACTN|nr:hypothetical protein [Allocatelliglobosispora scoriae]MBB5873384.1 curli biogenesis system outer membrane secretion channel CsgG [Allocatelliglobosispora scoriae]
MRRTFAAAALGLTLVATAACTRNYTPATAAPTAAAPTTAVPAGPDRAKVMAAFSSAGVAAGGERVERIRA